MLEHHIWTPSLGLLIISKLKASSRSVLFLSKITTDMVIDESANQVIDKTADEMVDQATEESIDEAIEEGYYLTKVKGTARFCLKLVCVLCLTCLYNPYLHSGFSSYDN